MVIASTANVNFRKQRSSLRRYARSLYVNNQRRMMCVVVSLRVNRTIGIASNPLIIFTSQAGRYRASSSSRRAFHW